jgi:O-antigen/teichoic acid export membrane protein
VVQAATVAWLWRALPAGGAPAPLRPLLEYTARIYPSTVAHFLSYRLDLIVVSSLLGATAAGLYSLALNSVDAVARIGQTVATLLFPRFASEDAPPAHSIALARRAAGLAGAVSFGASVAVAAVVLYVGADRGADVRTIAVLLAVLAIGGGGVSAWGVLASFLAARNRLAAIARVNVAVLVVSVIVYLGLIPSVGVYGGAIGTSIGLGLATILGYREAGKAA